MIRLFRSKTVATVALLSATMLVAGCKTNDSSRVRTTETAEPAAEPAPAPQRSTTRAARYSYTPNAGAGFNVVGLPFPTGDEATSALLLHQVMPAQARKDAEFPVEYHVTNVTNGTLQNVTLFLESTSNLMITEASPQPMTGDSGLVWSIGDLGPRETQIVRARATAESTGMAGNCISVSYNNSLCAMTEIVNPELTIAKEVTPRVLRCDPITIVYTVCNRGTGLAENVTISDSLPRGITVDGRSSVSINVGNLTAGECRDVTVIAQAEDTGEFCSPASASADGGLTAESDEPCTVVVQPVLTIDCEARDNQYLGRNARFSYTVTNEGDGVAANTIITAQVPAGATVTGASNNGVVSGNSVNWSAGSLQPGDSRTVWLELTTNASSDVEVRAAANADCADAVTTRCSTAFRGIPAILLEVVDIVDPVEVGDTTVYRITVTNQGSAPDNDVTVVVELPAELEFVNATGATQFRRQRQTIRFQPVATLSVGQEVSWDLTVRAVGEGDVRTQFEMTSREKTVPIRETESTTLYR
ncbi:MAG: hypothetical protein Tsb0013_23760 [Phycisphaerales bacterium]